MEENTVYLAHYGVKGMKWRRHKKAFHAGLSEAEANHMELIKDALDILELKNRARKAKGGLYPISRKQQKPSGKGKKVRRRKKIHNMLAVADPDASRNVQYVRNRIRDYIMVSTSNKKKAKGAAKLGKRYVKYISKGINDTFNS